MDTAKVQQAAQAEGEVPEVAQLEAAQAGAVGLLEVVGRPVLEHLQLRRPRLLRHALPLDVPVRALLDLGDGRRAARRGSATS